MGRSHPTAPTAPTDGVLQGHPAGATRETNVVLGGVASLIIGLAVCGHNPDASTGDPSTMVCDKVSVSNDVLAAGPSGVEAIPSHTDNEHLVALPAHLAGADIATDRGDPHPIHTFRNPGQRSNDSALHLHCDIRCRTVS